MKREVEMELLSDFTEEELELIKKALTEVVTKRVEKVKSLPEPSLRPQMSLTRKCKI